MVTEQVIIIDRFNIQLKATLSLIGQKTIGNLLHNIFYVTMKVGKNAVNFYYSDAPINYEKKIFTLPDLFPVLYDFTDKATLGKLNFSNFCEEMGLDNTNDDLKLWKSYNKKYYIPFKRVFNTEPETLMYDLYLIKRENLVKYG